MKKLIITMMMFTFASSFSIDSFAKTKIIKSKAIHHHHKYAKVAVKKNRSIQPQKLISNDLNIVIRKLDNNLKSQKINYSKPISKQHECIAKTIYYESRGESKNDRWLSGLVTINRSNSKSGLFANTLCGVIAQPSQYPWYKRKYKLIPKDKESWNLALNQSKVLLETMDHFDPSLPLFFHRKELHPNWSKDKLVLAKTEAHVFFNIN